MTEILFIDFLYLHSHKEANLEYFRLASINYKVTVIAPDGFYPIRDKNIHFISSERLNKIYNFKKNRINHFKQMLAVINLANKYRKDLTIILAFDTVLLTMGNFFLKSNKNTFLQHHNNIDGLKSIIKKNLFSTYSQKFSHLVFEQFMKEGLLNTSKINPQSITLLHYPLILSKGIPKIAPLYDFIALSNSNDEDIIREIIKKETSNNFFKLNRIKGIIRSKKTEYDNGFLKVGNLSYISDNEYSDLLSNTKIILMLFHNNFEYRLSATLMEALSNKKIVISSRIKHTMFINQNIKNNLRVFESVDELIMLIQAISDSNYSHNYDEYKTFIRLHSNNRIKSSFKRLLV